MTEILCNAADKEVLESIIWPRVQQFLSWREKNEPVDICPEPLHSDGVAGESCF